MKAFVTSQGVANKTQAQRHRRTRSWERVLRTRQRRHGEGLSIHRQLQGATSWCSRPSSHNLWSWPQPSLFEGSALFLPAG